MTMFFLPDAHGALESLLGPENFHIGKHLTKNDFVIHGGDTEHHLHNYLGLKFLEKTPWTNLLIDGNHDPLPDYYNAPIEPMFDGHVRVISDNVYYLQRGEVYVIDGKKIFVMGGAFSIDRRWRYEGMSWWPEEVPSEVEFRHAESRLDYYDWNIDIVLTHTCPLCCIDLFGFPVHPNTLYYDETWDRLETLFLRMNPKPKSWFFGHWHRDAVRQHLGTTFYSCYREIQVIR